MRRSTGASRRSFPAHLWVLVQHSAWAGRKRDKQFMGGLEEASVNEGSSLAKRIKAVGGKLYKEYMECCDEGYKYMYPDGYKGITPMADQFGEFHPRLKVDGRSIFLPKATEVKTSCQTNPT